MSVRMQMRDGAAVLVMVALAGCAWTPRQREAFVREVAKATVVVTVERVICGHIEKRREMEGGYFDVSKGQCRSRQAPNGNLVFAFTGSGRFSKNGGAGDFQQDVLVEYEVRIAQSGYVYVLPVRVEVDDPRVFNLNLLARVAEGLLGYVSGAVRDTVDEGMNRPRTIILSLQGHQCVLDGWIPSGAIPVRCDGERAGESFFPVGGSYEPLPRAPAGWASEALNLTAALVPEALPPAEPKPAVERGPAVAAVRSSVVPVAEAVVDAVDESPSSVVARETPSPVPVRQRLPLGRGSFVAPSRVEQSAVSAAPVPSPVVDAPHRRGPLVRAAPLVEQQQDALPVVEAVVERPPLGPAPTRSLNWARVGDGPVREFIAQNGNALAERIRQVAHPTGKKAGLLSFEVRAEGDVTAVELEVAWSGRVAGSAYRTAVIWEFSPAQHGRLVVMSSTEGTGVPPEAVAELDTYFRDSVFPRLVKQWR